MTRSMPCVNNVQGRPIVGRSWPIQASGRLDGARGRLASRGYRTWLPDVVHITNGYRQVTAHEIGQSEGVREATTSRAPDVVHTNTDNARSGRLGLVCLLGRANHCAYLVKALAHGAPLLRMGHKALHITGLTGRGRIVVDTDEAYATFRRVKAIGLGIDVDHKRASRAGDRRPPIARYLPRIM